MIPELAKTFSARIWKLECLVLEHFRNRESNTLVILPISDFCVLHFNFKHEYMQIVLIATTWLRMLFVDINDLLYLFVAPQEYAGPVMNMFRHNFQHTGHLAVHRLTSGCTFNQQQFDQTF